MQIPDYFKENRTILIPKVQDEEELAKLSSWRPLTIRSVWIRLNTKSLAKRLTTAVVICNSQKGFISAPGHEKNISILDHLIKSKTEWGQVSFGQINNKKAILLHKGP